MLMVASSSALAIGCGGWGAGVVEIPHRIFWKKGSVGKRIALI